MSLVGEFSKSRIGLELWIFERMAGKKKKSPSGYFLFVITFEIKGFIAKLFICFLYLRFILIGTVFLLLI